MNRPNTTAALQQDLDIFEDDDDEIMPGPGTYYNPNQHTCFKTGKIPEKLQFFGSTVDRFGDQKSQKKQGLGPGSYSVNNLVNYQKKANGIIYSGFTSTE